MNLTVLGAGAWGTALAVSVCARHPTRLWARDAEQITRMRHTRRNALYLPSIDLPPALQFETDLDAALAHARGGLVIVATPMAGLEAMLRRVGANASSVLWLCKGFEPVSGRLGHELARELVPQLRTGVLSGPSFAIEVARGQPTALVAASTDAALCIDAVQALHGESLRIYTSDDPIGVEVGGAVKNVLAIATGIADGMPAMPGAEGGLGLNARAALITRGLAEMTRLGVALGARAETFMGLSGLGDLVLTATGHLSRNRTVGRLLAQGLPLARILTELGHVAEGVSTAPMVLQRARALGVEMPITQAVAAVLDGHLTPAHAIEQLMGRGARPES
ncbi:MAG: NAD(P)H-dependent glycerol-3-phosphate dehydrogenase [Burkholderiales bacterium]